jgi:hypothetical protein
LQFTPYEYTTLLQLIDTDNKVLNKILVVFATLCAEVRCLQSEAKYKYYDTVLFYGEGGTRSPVVQPIKQQNRRSLCVYRLSADQKDSYDGCSRRFEAFGM